MNRSEGAKARLFFFDDARFLDEEGRRIELPKAAYPLGLYLVLEHKNARTTRRDAALFLWPEARDASANMRQLIQRIRAEKASPQIFEIDNTHVRLRLDQVGCDVIEFRERIVDLNFANAEGLLDIHGSGLLAGWSSSEDEISRWVANQADSFRAVLTAALADLLDRKDASANPAQSLVLANRLLGLSPHEEAAWRALMRTHAAMGAMGRVKQVFDQCSAALRDLGTNPEAETAKLFATLTAGYAPQGSAKSSGGSLTETRASAPGMLPRLAVLPPQQSVSSDEGIAVIAALLLEDVVVGLCSMKTINLVAPHTSWSLRKGLINDEALLQRFHIGYVLESSILPTAHGSRLITKLFNSVDRSIIWADSAPLSPTTSEQCCRSVAVGIVLSLADAIERSELARFEAEHPTAYYWTLVGQRHLRQLDLPEVRRASKAFRRAIASDPNFAPAHSGRARALQREWLLLGQGDVGLLDDAEKSGQQASEIDQRDARAYRELGLCSLYKRRFDDSLAFHQQAEHLSPQYADAIADYADALAHSGRPEEGLAKMKKAMELNPIPPEQYWWDMAGMYFQLSEYEKAIRTVARMEHPTAGLRIAAASWALLGEQSKAARCAETFLESYPDFRVEKWLALVPNRNRDDTQHYEFGLRAADSTERQEAGNDCEIFLGERDG